MVPRPHDNENETPSDVQALCDPETGTCALPGAAQTSAAPSAEGPVGEVLYVGDPMCSWCWGGSPGLRELEAAANRKGIPFRIR
ncbi:DsbA family protein, partial [Corallococcus exiguus]